MNKITPLILLTVLFAAPNVCVATAADDAREARLRAHRRMALRQLYEKQQQERARKEATVQRLQTEKEMRGQETESTNVSEKKSSKGTMPDVRWKYEIQNGCVTILSASPAVGDIVIPSEIEGNPVTTIAPNAFKDCDELISVKIPKGVSDVFAGAFSGCRSLQSVSLPPGLKMICGELFKNCSSLTYVEIPASVKMVGPFAFDGCVSLKKLIFPTTTMLLERQIPSHIEIVRKDDISDDAGKSEEIGKAKETESNRADKKYSASAYLKILQDAREKAEFKEEYARRRVSLITDNRVKIKTDSLGSQTEGENSLEVKIDFVDEENFEVESINIVVTDQGEIKNLKRLNPKTVLREVSGIVAPPSSALLGKDEVTLTDVKVLAEKGTANLCDKITDKTSISQLLKIVEEAGALTSSQYKEIGEKLKNRFFSFTDWDPPAICQCNTRCAA